jgi:GPH family glycoside/pentoside/hexuronide:cation symporter
VTDVAKKPGEERLGLRELISEFAIIIKDKYWLVMIIIRLITTIGTAFFIVGASYYALYVLNDMGKMGFLMASNLVPSIIIMLITPFLMKRINKRKMFIAGLVVSLIGTASLGLFGTTVPAVVGSLLICSTGAGLFAAVNFGIIADIVTYTKMTTGRFVAGIGNAGVSAVRKLGMGLNSVLFGFVLSLAGFDATLKVQPDSVVTAFRFLYSWAPFIGFAISLILFVAFYDLDKKFDSIKAEYDKANEE